MDPSLDGFGDMQVIHGSSSHRDGISASYWEAEKSVKDADDDSAARLWSSLQTYRIPSPSTHEWPDQEEGYQRRSSSTLKTGQYAQYDQYYIPSVFAVVVSHMASPGNEAKTRFQMVGRPSPSS
ncbi:MAG: hypothetical protein Q9206_001511 [Seirophora lacunosa]